jgi:hypothetical protein
MSIIYKTGNLTIKSDIYDDMIDKLLINNKNVDKKNINKQYNFENKITWKNKVTNNTNDKNNLSINNFPTL